MNYSKTDTIAFVEGVYSAFGVNPTINISTEAATRNSFLKFKSSVINNNIIARVFSRIKKEISTPESFRAILTDEEFVKTLTDDARGKKIKITLSKDEIAHKTLRKTFEGKFTFNESEINDPDNAFVIRNADGFGEPMFVEGEEEFISKCAHQLSQLYHYETNTKYYDARPIKYSTWVANPETRLQTRFAN